MPRETEGGYDPEMELGKRKQELFEDNVNKDIKQFIDKENELRELLEEKKEIAMDKNHTEDHEHVLYQIREFEEALRRIEEEKSKEA